MGTKEYHILTGTAIEVEDQLNKLGSVNTIIIWGVTATNELTTMVIQLTGQK